MCDLDLRLAAELGRCLLEQNQDLKNYIHVLQKQIEEKDYDMKVRKKSTERKKKTINDDFLISYYIRNFFRLVNNSKANVNKVNY